MSPRLRYNRTIFDKLATASEFGRFVNSRAPSETRRELQHFFAGAAPEASEEELLATVRRELSWLLNTTHFASDTDLRRYPHVQTSVLNFGVPAMAGRSLNPRAVQLRAREIRSALLAFEPRIVKDTLRVEVAAKMERSNSLTFVIHAEISTPTVPLPITLRTDIEIDSATVTVRD